MLEELIIEGDVTLEGTVSISGSKNAALPILCATLLTDEVINLHNVPNLSDVYFIEQLLEKLGAEINKDQNSRSIQIKSLKTTQADYEIVRKMRASVLVLAPILMRAGEAYVSLPGGCALGLRAIDIHLEGLKQMGVSITLEQGYVHAKADRIYGAEIDLKFPSVGATETLIMAATLAEGTTILNNAAREPEIICMAEFLIKMGAKIQGHGTSTIIIEGVSKLKGTDFHIIPDRLETGTYAIAALMTGGRLYLKNTDIAFMDPLISVLEGIKVTPMYDGFIVEGKVEKGANISTNPHPGFPTDLQAPVMALLTQASGISIIKETIFENRFMHVPELCRMGAKISLDGRNAIIEGGTKLTGAPVMATDIRGGAALVLAALAAKGTSVLKRIYHLDRGYDSLDQRLNACGANIVRTRQNEAVA